jgi:hypothetical protein
MTLQRITRTTVVYQQDEALQETRAALQHRYGTFAPPRAYFDRERYFPRAVALRIQREDLALDWDDHQESRESATLFQLAQEKNRDRQPTATYVTPHQLWFHPLNAELRKQHLLIALRGIAGSERSARISAIDEDPSNVRLQRGSHVWIPFPHVLRARPVACAAESASSYQVAPDWLTELVRCLLLPIVRSTVELRRLSDVAEAHALEGMRATGPLIALDRLMMVLREVYGTEANGLDASQTQLRALLNALGAQLKNPASAYYRDVRRNRLPPARVLLDMLRLAALNDGCVRALQVDDMQLSLLGEVSAPSLRGYIGRVLVDGYQELMRVPQLEDDAYADLTAAQAAFPETCRPPSRGSTALATMMSDGRALGVPRMSQPGGGDAVRAVGADTAQGWALVGTLASIVGNSVGDLPGGTNSLAVTVQMVRLQRIATDYRARIHAHRGEALNRELAAEARTLGKSLDAANPEELVEALRAVQREWVGHAPQGQLRSYNPAQLNQAIRAYREKGVENYQSRGLWPLALTALNAIGLIAVIAQGYPDDDASASAYVEFWGGLAGGQVNVWGGMATGAAELHIRATRAAGAALSPLSTSAAVEVAAVLGNVATWLAVGTGTLRVVFYLREGNYGPALRAAAETAATTLAMWAPWPTIQAAAIAFSLGVAVYDLADIVCNVFTPAVEGVAGKLVEGFKTSDKGRLLLPLVQAPMQSFERVLDDAAFPHVSRTSDRGGRVRGALTELAFSNELIDAVFDREFSLSPGAIPVPALGV